MVAECCKEPNCPITLIPKLPFGVLVFVKIVKFDVAPLAPGTTLDGENQERQILVGTLSGLASPLNTIGFKAKQPFWPVHFSVPAFSCDVRAFLQ
jgi:hypothetical protein